MEKIDERLVCRGGQVKISLSPEAALTLSISA